MYEDQPVAHYTYAPTEKFTVIPPLHSQTPLMIDL